MGGTHCAVARDVEAVGWNPANLALPREQSVSISLVSVGVTVANSAFSLGDYNRYNGETWTEATKEEILGRVPSGGLDVGSGAEARALGFSWRNFALSASAVAAGHGRVDRDPLELLLFGNEPDSVYRLEDTAGRTHAMWQVAVSWAYPVETKKVKSLGVGITARYHRGLGYYEVGQVRGEMVSLDTGWRVEGDARARRAEGGTGFSVDIGLAAELDDKWTLGVSLANVGSVTWNKKARANNGSITADSLRVRDLTEAEAFEDLFDPVDESLALQAFSASVPTVVRAGMAWKDRRLLLAFDWEQGVRRAPGATLRPRVSAGAEVQVTGWHAVRSGVSVGGRDGTVFAFGLGFGRKPVSLDVGACLRGSVIPNAASGTGLSADLKLGF